MRRADLTRRYLLLGFSGPVIVLNLWLLGLVFHYFEQLITILVTAAILSLLLNYLVQLFERVRLSRLQAVLMVLFITLVALVLMGLTLIPMVLQQATQLLEGLPEWLNDASTRLLWLERLSQNRMLPFRLDQLTAQAEQQIQTLLGLLPGLAVGTLGKLFDTVLIVVLAFYMLLYGGQLWQGLMGLLPPPLGQALSTSLRLNFQRFFISQLLLGLFMVVVLIPIFLVLQVNFGLLFALIIGGFNLIPFIGAALGIGLVVLLALTQGPWLALQVAIAALVVQQIKDNLLTPKLLGNAFGLNPLWIFIALLIGARVAGLLGVLLSIPVAGSIKSTGEAMGMAKSAPTPPMMIHELPPS